MSEELQKALSELLGKANDGIDSASGFLVAELPDVIHQLLMWHGVYSFITCLLSIITLIVTYKVSINIANKTFNAEGESFINYPHVIFPIAIISAIVVPVSLSYINIEWLQIWIAPKVWLIEYAAKLAG